MSKGKSEYEAWAGVAVFCLVSIACILIWHYFHTQISWTVMWGAYWSTRFIHSIYTLLRWAGIPDAVFYLMVDPRDFSKMIAMANAIPTVEMSGVKPGDLPKHLTVVGMAARIVLPPFAIYWIVMAYKKTGAARRQFTYNIFSLAKHNMHFFPHIKPAILSDLLKSDPDKGYFRREDSPIRFCIKHGLIQFYRRDYKDTIEGEPVLASIDPADVGKPGVQVIPDDLQNHIRKIHRSCIFNEVKAREVLMTQLGSKWAGSDDLPVLVRALYAALIAIACGDKDTGFNLLRQFNATWDHPTKKDPTIGFDVSGVDEAIYKFEGNGIIQAMLKQHAYVNPMMIAALFAARRKGKVLCSSFLWLKIADRTLWYSLNQAGGQTAWSEAAGPWSHYLTEKIVGRAIEAPQVDEALRGLVEFLDREEGWLYSEEYEQRAVK